MKNRRLLSQLALHLVAASVLVFFASCSNIFVFADQCEVDEDCGKGQLCESSFFSARCAVICECDSDCNDDEICIRRPTEPNAPARCARGCRTHADCDGEGERCVDELCRTGCIDDGDCGANEYCDPERKCVTRECEQSSDCGEGFVCEGVCVKGCHADDDCPGGEGCVRLGDHPGTCTPAACIGDEDCSQGEICLCGLCHETCESDDDCEEHQHCALTVQECTPRRCQTRSDLVCSHQSCPTISQDDWKGSLITPCCIGGSEEGRCGFRAMDLLARSDSCGERLMQSQDCDCEEDECCLSDGTCGRRVSIFGLPPGVFELCTPKSEEESPTCGSG